MVKKISLHLDLTIGRKTLSCGLTSFLLAMMAIEVGSENVTLTTYYPAPSGVYAKMITTQSTYHATAGGATGKVGIGTTNPGYTLDIGAAGGADGSLRNQGAVYLSQTTGDVTVGGGSNVTPANVIVNGGSVRISGQTAPVNTYTCTVAGGCSSIDPSVCAGTPGCTAATGCYWNGGWMNFSKTKCASMLGEWYDDVTCIGTLQCNYADQASCQGHAGCGWTVSGVIPPSAINTQISATQADFGGNGTFIGNLSVTGNATVTHDLTVNGNFSTKQISGLCRSVSSNPTNTSMCNNNEIMAAFNTDNSQTLTLNASVQVPSICIPNPLAGGCAGIIEQFDAANLTLSFPSAGTAICCRLNY